MSVSVDPFNLSEGSAFIDGPILLEQEEGETEIDLSKDDYDLISNKDHVVKATHQELQQLYGDLPEELWEERPQVEQHFIAATPEQKHYDDKSHALLEARRSFIVGLSNKAAFAFQCPDVQGAEEEEDDDEHLSVLAKIEKKNAKYAKQNPGFALKAATNALENNALYHRLSYDIDYLNNQSSAQLKLQEFRAIQTVDPSLGPAIKRAGPLLSNAFRTLPKDAPLKPQRSKMRPGNGFATCEYYSSSVNEKLSDAPASSKKTTFRLLTCRVPRPNEKKPPFWKDRSCVIECVMGTIPATSVNDKDQMAVLYQPALKVEKRGLLRLDVFQVQGASADKIKRTQRLEFYFPSMFAPEGMLCTSLDDDAIFAVSFSSGVMVLDLNKSEAGFHVLWLTMDVDEECKLAPQALVRHVTCVRVEGDIVILGTDKGELFTVNWRDQEVLSIDHTPAVEPIFSASVRNRNAFIHTVAGMTVARAPPHRPILLNMERPLAFDTCGDLIFVLTKYGGYQVYNTSVRKVLYQGEPVKQDLLHTGAQHAYPGIKAYPEHVVCVYPNGVIRRITLIRTK